MFCTKCGKEIENGNKFCTNCGTQVGGKPMQADPSQLLQIAAAKIGPMKDKAVAAMHTAAEAASPAKDKLVAAGKAAVKAAGPAVRDGASWLAGNSATVVRLAKVAAFVIMIFLWFSKLVKLSVLGTTQEFSMLDMSEGAQWVSYLTAVILAAGAVCSAFPGICPKCSVPMLASGWTAFWFISSVLTASSQLTDYSRYEPAFTVTFAGWLLGILSIGMLVLTVLEALKRKRSPQTTESEN